MATGLHFTTIAKIKTGRTRQNLARNWNVKQI